jgi:hypothetical protein
MANTNTKDLSAYPESIEIERTARGLVCTRNSYELQSSHMKITASAFDFLSKEDLLNRGALKSPEDRKGSRTTTIVDPLCPSFSPSLQ